MNTTTDSQIKAIENTIAVIRASIWSFENGGKSPNALNDFANLGITTDKDYEKALKNLIAALEMTAENLKDQKHSDQIKAKFDAIQSEMKDGIEKLIYDSETYNSKNFIVWTFENGKRVSYTGEKNESSKS